MYSSGVIELVRLDVDEVAGVVALAKYCVAESVGVMVGSSNFALAAAEMNRELRTSKRYPSASQNSSTQVLCSRHPLKGKLS